MKRSAKEFNNPITKANPKVDKKPSVSKCVPIKMSAILRIATVITKLNKPKVIIVNGNEKSLIIGLTVAFKNPKTITKTTAYKKPLMVMLSNK